MAWQQNWSQPLNNFTMPGVPTQSQMGPFNPMQFNPTMTPEQHYAMQQNWQQWQTYQQQYAQWQATYGEKYQQEMQQKFNQNATIMPQAGAISNLPPPPPNQPAPLPPPPPENEAQARANILSNDPANQRSFQANAAAGSMNRTSNFLNQPAINQQQFSRGIGGGISQSPNQFSGHIARNKFESPAGANLPATNDFVAKPPNQPAEDLTDKTPEEKAFDEQFQKWEEEFTSWKSQNANHPDTRAYLEYEQKMEECRTKLLERREQMKRRKLELLQQQQKLQPVQATPVAQEQSRISNESKFGGYSHSSSGSLDKNDLMEKVVSSDVQPPENSSINKSQLFMRASGSGAGIPGLDLVLDKPNDNGDDGGIDNDTVVIDDTSPKRVDKSSHQNANVKQRPDLEAISRNINSILGDPKLVSLLSNFQPKSIQNPATKSAIPSLLDMKMPDIDLDNVPRFNWKDDDEEDEGDSVPSIHQRQENDLSNNVPSNENTQQHSNQLNNCEEDDQYDDDFDADREHERFADMNYENSNDRPFQMNREDNDNFPMMNSRDNFNRNRLPNPGMNFMNDNEPNDNFNKNRSNFMNDSEPNDNFHKNRPSFVNDNGGPKDNFNQINFTNDGFNQNRSDFNENMRGNNSFADARNAGNFSQQNSLSFQGNRMNPFDKPAFGNNSNFDNDIRNQMGNNFPHSSNFGGNNNFGNNFGRSMNDQFNGENNEFQARDDDRNSNINDFGRRRNFSSNDGGPNFDTSNSQFPLNFRNNSRSDDNNLSQNNSQQFNGIHNRGLPTDSLISDNAKDEDFFRPTKVIDYSLNSHKPTQITPKDGILMPMKVVDYGHQTIGIVSRPQNASHPRPANKYTGSEFFPVKTIDYNHSSNKHLIKEYYYSIVSKWDPTKSNNSKPVQSQPIPNKSTADGSGGEPHRPRVPPAQHAKTKELKEITYERLSSINTASKQGKKFKRALIMKRSTVNDYPIGHKFYPSVHWKLLNEECRKRPGLPTKRGNRKRKNGTVIPFNKILQAPSELNDYEEILSNDEDSLDEYEMPLDDCKTQKMGSATMKLSPILPVRQNVVLIEDILYNPGRQGRPHKIVIIMRGPPGSGKTFLAKLIKEKEAENGGAAVRILSIDDYFKTELDEVRKCPETGKNLNFKKMIYEYESEMEDTYMQYLMKSYKKTVVDGLFDFIIVDSINSTLRDYTEFYNFAKLYAFTPYTCEMETNPDICFNRNIHQRTLEDIKSYCDHWSKTPDQYLKLDFDSFVEDARSFDVNDQ